MKGRANCEDYVPRWLLSRVIEWLALASLLASVILMLVMLAG
nr:hypothetical protein [uncultured Cohaesibacter sp.]